MYVPSPSSGFVPTFTEPLPRLLGLLGKLGRAGTKGIADDLCPPQIELQEVGI